MSHHRAIFVAFTLMFTAAMTSLASAGCCQWGGYAPTYYAPPAIYAGGCGGCCGGCGVATVPPVLPAPIAVDHWDTGGFADCGGCGGWVGCGNCGEWVACGHCGAARSYVPAMYIVNQGPEYAGPGIMIPYRHWSPTAGSAFAADYPYISEHHYRFGSAHPTHFANRDHPPMSRSRVHTHRALNAGD